MKKALKLVIKIIMCSLGFNVYLAYFCTITNKKIIKPFHADTYTLILIGEKIDVIKETPIYNFNIILLINLLNKIYIYLYIIN